MLRRKRSESPTPPNETSDTSPPACKKPKTDNGEDKKTPEPAAVNNEDKNKDKVARTHKSDKVDFATRLTAAAPRCPQKAYKNRLRCCESLYDALASESEASKFRLSAANSSRREKANLEASRMYSSNRLCRPRRARPRRRERDVGQGREGQGKRGRARGVHAAHAFAVPAPPLGQDALAAPGLGQRDAKRAAARRHVACRELPSSFSGDLVPS